jgi:hypothetical protein
MVMTVAELMGMIVTELMVMTVAKLMGMIVSELMVSPCFPQFPFYLLGDPSSYARGANIHLLHPWLAINCSPLAA